jgi:DNA-binding transcriptional MerR regulator
MTIEDLAQASGCTTRNIRNYQTRGLLPPPAVVSRTGYYDEGHLARLRLIAKLQGRGYSLAAIADLARAWEDGKDVGDLLGFERALIEPWGEDERPERVPLGAILDRFPEAATDQALIDRAIRLGLFAFDGDHVMVLRPRAVAIGADLVAAGVPLDAALDELESLVEDADRVATRFVGLFDRYVWEPFQAAGLPAEGLPDVTATLERLRPLAARAVADAMRAAMDERVAAAAVERLAQQQPSVNSPEATA